MRVRGTKVFPLAVTGVAGTTALGSPTVQNVLEIPVTGVAGNRCSRNC